MFNPCTYAGICGGLRLPRVFNCISVFQSHIMAAKAVANTLKTSLGPNGRTRHTLLNKY